MTDGMFKLWMTDVVDRAANVVDVFQVGHKADIFQGLVSESRDISEQLMRDESYEARREKSLFDDEEDDWQSPTTMDSEPEYWEQYRDDNLEEVGETIWIREGMLEAAGERQGDRTRDLIHGAHELFRNTDDGSAEHEVAYALLDQVEFLEKRFVVDGQVDLSMVITGYQKIMHRLEDVLDGTAPNEQQDFMRWAGGHAVSIIEAGTDDL